MDYKPANKATAPHRLRYDGRKGEAPGANPWEVVAKVNPFSASSRRRRWASDTKGATPPRDGPFAEGAAAVALMAPPVARSRRSQPASPVVGQPEVQVSPVSVTGPPGPQSPMEKVLAQMGPKDPKDPTRWWLEQWSRKDQLDAGQRWALAMSVLLLKKGR